jgi:hypothetical protein
MIKILIFLDAGTCVRELFGYAKRRLMVFRNKCLILFRKAIYRFYLRTKRDGLPLHRVAMCRRLLDTEREFVAKHGCDWRLCVFDDQVVQFLKLSKYVHGALWPNS